VGLFFARRKKKGVRHSLEKKGVRHSLETFLNFFFPLNLLYALHNTIS
jgi:hypothetical protein